MSRAAHDDLIFISSGMRCKQTKFHTTPLESGFWGSKFHVIKCRRARATDGSFCCLILLLLSPPQQELLLHPVKRCGISVGRQKLKR